MVIDPDPLLVIRREFGPEVCEEVNLPLLIVQKIILAAYKCELSMGTQRLRLFDFLLVGLLVFRELRIVHEIDTEVFMPDFCCFAGHSKRRIEIQIKSYPAARQQTLPKSNFSGFHDLLSF